MIRSLLFILAFTKALDVETPLYKAAEIQDGEFIDSLEALFENYDALDAPIIQSEQTTDVFEMPNVDIQECKKQIRLAAITYCPGNQILDKTCINFDATTSNVDILAVIKSDKHKTLGFVSVNHAEKKISVSYRGTKNLVNWLLNIHFSKKKFVDGARIHAGFKILANSLLPQTLNYVKQLLVNNPEYGVVFIGHSMGGAIAMINAVETMKKLKLAEEKISVYTYGQPRLGDKKFVRYINKLKWNINRVFNKKDLVPNVPPNWVGYYHTNVGIGINSVSDTTICNPNLIEDLACMAVATKSKIIDAHFVFWDYTIKSMV